MDNFVTDWSHYEEPVRVVCEAFLVSCNTRGFTGQPDRRLAKEWAAGAREWLDVFGENTELLDRAVHYMRKQDPPLIVASPRSCIKVAREMSQWGEPDVREKYAGGEYGRFVEA